MPGTATATAPSTAPAENRGKQLEAYLRDAGSGDAEKRKAAELRLAIFPHSLILAYLPPLWQQELRRRERLKYALIGALVLAFFLIFPAGILLVNLKHQEGFRSHGTELDLLRRFLMFFAQSSVITIAGFLTFGKNIQSGAIYALVQHQCLDLVPLLIEALPLLRPVGTGSDSRPLVMAALTRLLPRFALTDRKPLTRRQRQVLLDELRQFDRTLNNPLAALTPEEADFLSSVLHFLPVEYSRERGEGQHRLVSDLVENLAMEKMDSHEEPAARTRVRESARAALVRLSM